MKNDDDEDDDDQATLFTQIKRVYQSQRLNRLKSNPSLLREYLL